MNEYYSEMGGCLLDRNFINLTEIWYVKQTQKNILLAQVVKIAMEDLSS
jgi:hypothetical protein